jgi:UDP:flavonoid glycosyltransferase YjiC (YdhE family)
MIPMLAHGLPLLLLPRGANQFWHAEAAVGCGAALRLLPGQVSPESIRAGVRTILQDPGYRRNARRIEDEIRAMPSARSAVGWLERLSGDRRPLG